MNKQLNMISLTEIMVFFGILLTIVMSVLSCNDGTFMYILDDPYIHLALGENILKGNYGVNIGEHSSPSSSAIWIYFVLAVDMLFLRLIPLEYIPFVINVASSVGIIIVINKLIYHSIDKANRMYVSIISIVFLFASANLFGLIMTGMEHSLQIFIVSFIAYRVILNKKEDNLLVASLIISPLIRYENLAVVVAVLLFFLLRREYRKVLLVGLLTAAGLAIFSAYLHSLGLELLPASVMLKKGMTADNIMGINFYHVVKNFTDSKMFSVLFLLTIFSIIKIKQHRELLISLLIAQALHLFFGRTGWYSRYEIYILVFSFMILVYVYKDIIKDKMSPHREAYVVVFALMIMSLSLLTTYGQFILPSASNNIYSQQNIMGKIARKYNKPIAVNDIGLVTYRNQNYVLDLYGLASKEARIARETEDIKTMRKLVKKHNVGLVMIYDSWIKSKPKEWKLIAKLILSKDKKRVFIPSRTVSFYSTGVDSNLSQELKKFSIYEELHFENR